MEPTQPTVTPPSNTTNITQPAPAPVEPKKRGGWIMPVIIVILLFLILWLLAMHYNWGPFKDDASTNQSANTSQESDTTPASGINGTNGTNGADGADAVPTTPTTPTTPATTTSPILTFSTTVNTGDTKEQVDVKAGSIGKSCTVTAATTTVGKQEVCVYTEGSKVVTVTYLNDKVVNVTRTGL